VFSNWQVLYHLFEGFSLIGQENIETVDIIAGVGSFFVIVIGAPGIGILLGLFGALLSRFTYRIRIMEPLIVLVICYMSFIIQEMFHLSGILG
jgi:NhaP-type Na+/H+ or K+/H+ antiporter